MIVKPRILPRNFFDLLFTFTIGFVQIFFLFLLPSFLIGLFFGKELGLASFILIYIIFLMFTVTKLTLTETGIRFHRILGRPRFLKWDQIDSIVVADRYELMFKGWLWPPFPCREITPSLTTENHSKISYDRDKIVFFPPKSLDEFMSKASDLKANYDLLIQ